MKRLFLLVVLFFAFVVNVWGIGPYSNNGDGTVIDKGTGLMWQQSDDGVKKNWKDALAYCEDLTLAGYNDWRLPNIRELKSIIKYDAKGPAIDTTVFACQNAGNYWSSTIYVGNIYDAWEIFFYSGNEDWHDKAGKLWVRCVRGSSDNLSDTGETTCFGNGKSEIPCPSKGEDFYGQDGSYQKLEQKFQVKEIAGDKVVEDLNTKFMWQQSDDGTKRTWQEAKDYCNNLTSAGYNDWRLPTLFELSTIVNYGNYFPAIDKKIFNCLSQGYWSSTILAWRDKDAWGIDFYYGNSFYHNKLSHTYYVRCVRSGLSDGSVQEICDSSHLENCNNKTDCIGASGYWYNNQCNSSVQKVCDSSNLENCNNETDCVGASGYWYNNHCNNESNSNNNQNNSNITNIKPLTLRTPIKYNPTNPVLPSNVPVVNVSAKSDVIIQPTISVPGEIQGKSGVALLYIKLGDMWIPLPEKQVASFASTYTFTNFATKVDLTKAKGLSFEVWYGIIVNNGALYFDYYRVNIVDDTNNENIIISNSEMLKTSGGTYKISDMILQLQSGAIKSNIKIGAGKISSTDDSDLSYEYAITDILDKLDQPMTVKLPLTKNSTANDISLMYIPAKGGYSISAGITPYIHMFDAHIENNYVVGKIYNFVKNDNYFSQSLWSKIKDKLGINDVKDVYSFLQAKAMHRELTNDGNFKIYYPVNFGAFDNPSLSLIDDVIEKGLTRASDKLQKMGFDFNALHKPIPVVFVKDTLMSNLLNKAEQTKPVKFVTNKYPMIKVNIKELLKAKNDTKIADQFIATMGHEFFHTVQNLYDPAWLNDGSSVFLAEASSVWFEYIMSSHPTTYYSDVVNANTSFQNYGLDDTVFGKYNVWTNNKISSRQDLGYGAAIFLLYTTISKSNNNLIYDVWENYRNGDTAVKAMKKAFDLKTMWRRFAMDFNTGFQNFPYVTHAKWPTSLQYNKILNVSKEHTFKKTFSMPPYSANSIYIGGSKTSDYSVNVKVNQTGGDVWDTDFYIFDALTGAQLRHGRFDGKIISFDLKESSSNKNVARKLVLINSGDTKIDVSIEIDGTAKTKDSDFNVSFDKVFFSDKEMSEPFKPTIKQDILNNGGQFIFVENKANEKTTFTLSSHLNIDKLSNKSKKGDKVGTLQVTIECKCVRTDDKNKLCSSNKHFSGNIGIVDSNYSLVYTGSEKIYLPCHYKTASVKSVNLKVYSTGEEYSPTFTNKVLIEAFLDSFSSPYYFRGADFVIKYKLEKKK